MIGSSPRAQPSYCVHLTARTYAPDGDYDLMLSVGSTQVFGGFAGTLELAGRWLRGYRNVLGFVTLVLRRT